MATPLKIIGIGGTNGSGKDTLAEFLASEHGWLFVSISDILREELKQRGLPIERHHLRALGTQWRRQHGWGHIIDKAVGEYKKAKGSYKGLVVASLRHPGEADRIHQLGGRIVWVDAPPKLRYERIYNRGRSAEDNKTFEEFQAEEKAEMTHSGDKTTLNMSDVKAKADILIYNDNNDLLAFRAAAEKALKKYL